MSSFKSLFGFLTNFNITNSKNFFKTALGWSLLPSLLTLLLGNAFILAHASSHL